MRLVDLAPHCALPPMDGADKRAWNLYSEWAANDADAQFIGRDAIVNEGLPPRSYSESSGAWRDNKNLAALAAAISGRDYWQLKLVRPGAKAAAREAAKAKPDVILLNFLYALPMLRPFSGMRARLAVDTHNYDPGVFSGFHDAARNPIVRLLCRRAIATSRRALAALPAGALMVHVSQDDAAGWRKDRPDLAHEVIENGCSVRPRRNMPDYIAGGRKRLLFVGSLSAKMNQDALRHLGSTFWPSLKEAAELHVLGSNPPPWLQSFCAAQQWRLRANVSEDELEAAYSEAHFALLPFAYGAGSKLKLMEACGRGVPVLSTRSGLTGIEAAPPLVTASDDPSAWSAAVTAQRAPSALAIEQTIEFARQFSWPALARRLREKISRMPETVIDIAHVAA